MQHLTQFTKTTELTPVQQELSDSCHVQFIHDDSGIDWYVLQHRFQPDTLKIQYDKNGLIVAADTDVSKFFPLGFSVVELPATDVPYDFQPGKFLYNDGAVLPVPVDYVAIATAERDRRMNAITARITALVEAQDDGDITQDELEELAKLRADRIALRRLDLSSAPRIEWPV